MPADVDFHLLPIGNAKHISDLPDECLAYIFKFLGSLDGKSCSLVCRRWFRCEGQSQQRLSLNAKSDLLPVIPSLFTRFDFVTELALKCDPRSISIGDDALVLISLRCRNLICLKLCCCLDLTHVGMVSVAVHCKGLKKLYCDSCIFGAKGMNAVLDHSSSLEELSVKRLTGITNMPIGPGVAAYSLKTICIEGLNNSEYFGPLIISSKNLRTLKILGCRDGDWNKLLEAIAEQVTGLVEVEVRTDLSNVGLAAISNWSNLEILYLFTTSRRAGLVSIADHCKLLRVLHIHGWEIRDGGLIAIAKQCPNIQELVLVGAKPTCLSLGLLASNCQNLERLALCWSNTFGDEEISCIAAKCMALKNFCIIACPVTDHGMDAISGGFPKLVELKVKKCWGVTCEGADRLRACRVSLAVNLDHSEFEVFPTRSFFDRS
ncbi:F-box protein At1g47056-like [Telopea speciosissima]|uniref:F-box protein At1g47056-like n=1 Tax=Telopea speciosissima TaxID=54955 RepID=UPI001CC6D0A8|nr:F-box protein At1g47056-like [Telopea speciosissima]